VVVVVMVVVVMVAPKRFPIANRVLQQAGSDELESFFSVFSLV
jgi:hypothetical protein